MYRFTIKLLLFTMSKFIVSAGFTVKSLDQAQYFKPSPSYYEVLELPQGRVINSLDHFYQSGPRINVKTPPPAWQSSRGETPGSDFKGPDISNPEELEVFDFDSGLQQDSDNFLVWGITRDPDSGNA